MKWRIGETFKIPFLKRTYLTVKLDEGRFAMPPDWRGRALEMWLGKRPADAEFLARAWMRECEGRNKATTDYLKTLRILERKLQAQKTQLRLHNKPSEKPHG